MGIAARQLEQRVVATLIEAGANLTGKRIDGSGHQVVSYSYNGHHQTFHFPHSSKLNGCGPKNILARLRRLMKEATPAAIIELGDLTVKPPTLTGLASDVPVSVSPKTPGLRRERRKEIAKRYQSLRCMDLVAEEFGLSFEKVRDVLLAYGSDQRRLVERELNKRRQQAAKRQREIEMRVHDVEAPEPPQPVQEHKLPKAIPTQKGRRADNSRRNLQIARLIFRQKVPVNVVADHYGLKPASVTLIARDASPLLNKGSTR